MIYNINIYLRLQEREGIEIYRDTHLKLKKVSHMLYIHVCVLVCIVCDVMMNI